MNVSDIEKLIRKYERQAKRYRGKEQALEEKGDNLSTHGHWSLGYCGAKADLYEDVIDDLRDLLKDGGAES